LRADDIRDPALRARFERVLKGGGGGVVSDSGDQFSLYSKIGLAELQRGVKHFEALVQAIVSNGKLKRLFGVMTEGLMGPSAPKEPVVGRKALSS
jgi:hypothetical protein